MITKEKASSLLLSKYKKYEIQNSYDYKNFYIFTIIPKKYDEASEGAFLDNFYSVDKNTGEISGFAPWAETEFLKQFVGGD